MGFFKKKEKKQKSSKKNKDNSNPKINKKQKKAFRNKKNKEEIKDVPYLNTEEVKVSEEIEEKKPFSSKKKKSLIKTDMKNKPVYLEDTGEKLGTVFDTIYDKDNKIVGYKIKDKKSDAVLSFPLEQFDFNSDGLIFVPSWYTNAIKIIEKLEFKDKVSPEITALLSDDQVSNEELYDIFMKHDDEMVFYIDDARGLHETINKRLNLLEKQRLALKDDLMDLTEKRLIKDIDRREFSEDVQRHRRKVNILDLNIKKCKDILKRLENTSFGILGKNNTYKEEKLNKGQKRDEEIDKELYNKIIEVETKTSTYPKNEDKLVREVDTYKDKYFELKEQFDQLDEDYQELKHAVDKMLSKEV